MATTQLYTKQSVTTNDFSYFADRLKSQQAQPTFSLMTFQQPPPFYSDPTTWRPVNNDAFGSVHALARLNPPNLQAISDAQFQDMQNKFQHKPQDPVQARMWQQAMITQNEQIRMEVLQTISKSTSQAMQIIATLAPELRDQAMAKWNTALDFTMSVAQSIIAFTITTTDLVMQTVQAVVVKEAQILEDAGNDVKNTAEEAWKDIESIF